MSALDDLLARARACRLCADRLEPRPILRLTEGSRILLVGQAPGSKVHASGRPWDDSAGEHLRSWLGVDRTTFDDPENFGLLPMAFCYPGKAAGGDKPPPKICAETWHDPLRAALSGPRLVLLVGGYAIGRYLGAERPLTEVVREGIRDATFPLPHPAWRSKLWIAKNPWFTDEVLPRLRAAVQDALDARGP